MHPCVDTTTHIGAGGVNLLSSRVPSREEARWGGGFATYPALAGWIIMTGARHGQLLIDAVVQQVTVLIAQRFDGGVERARVDAVARAARPHPVDAPGDAGAAVGAFSAR